MTRRANRDGIDPRRGEVELAVPRRPGAEEYSNRSKCQDNTEHTILNRQSVGVVPGPRAQSLLPPLDAASPAQVRGLIWHKIAISLKISPGRGSEIPVGIPLAWYLSLPKTSSARDHPLPE